jgi:DNA-binding MarR family transcriptional regulator
MKRRSKVDWTDVDGTVHDYAFGDYMKKVAQARFVIRRAQMLIDGCARETGIGPLEHQALIQIYGAAGEAVPVGQLADRLNVAPALASRLVQQLEAAGFVRRTQSETDRRTMLVSATAQGETRLFQIVEKAHRKIAAFRLQASDSEREAAHEILSFYVGGMPKR